MTSKENIIMKIMAMDEEQIKRVESCINGNNNSDIEGVVSRARAAELLGLSLNRVDFYARKGVLRRVILPGAKRCIGFGPESVRRAIYGTF